MKQMFVHGVMTKNPDDVRKRIERELGVDANVSYFYESGGWSQVLFYSPHKDPDLDFLRPDVLPPR